MQDTKYFKEEFVSKTLQLEIIIDLGNEVEVANSTEDEKASNTTETAQETAASITEDDKE